MKEVMTTGFFPRGALIALTLSVTLLLHVAAQTPCTISANCDSHATAVNGTVEGGCTCTCSMGYTGGDCSLCAAGFAGTPCLALPCTPANLTCENSGTVFGDGSTGCFCACPDRLGGPTCATCALNRENYPTCTPVAAALIPSFWLKLAGDAQDSSGNQLNGMVDTGVTQTANVAGACAASTTLFHFDRTANSDIVLPGEAFSGLTDFTFSVRALISDTLDSTILSVSSVAANQLFVIASGGTVRVYLGGTQVISFLYDGWTQWTHFTLTRQGTVVTAYLNGIAVASSMTNEINTLDVIPLTNGAFLAAGQAVAGGAFAVSQQLKGSLQDARLYVYAQAATEVAAAAVCTCAVDSDCSPRACANVQCSASQCAYTTKPECLVAWFKLDGTATDATNNGYEGQLGPGITTTPGGPCYSQQTVTSFIHDITSYMQLPGTMFAAVTSFTASIWVKKSDTLMGAILSVAVPAQDNYLLVMSMESTLDVFLFQTRYLSYSFTFPNSWTHVAVVRDGSTLALYISGAMVASATVPATAFIDVPQNGAFLGQDQDTVGGAFDPTQAIQGQMSSFRYWRQALNASAIAALVSNPCQCTANSDCPAPVNSCNRAVCASGFCGVALAAAGAVCRPAAGTCDVAETCDGVSSSCPPDGLEPSGYVCRPAVAATPPAFTCDVAEVCSGTSAFCPADGFVKSGTICRSSAGACDAPEKCTGTSPVCPVDAFFANGTACRASRGTCDQTGRCNGTSIVCPPNVVRPSGFACRAAVGPCDVAEVCDGTAYTCPPNAIAAAGAVCRLATGACDLSELCDGVHTTCPADVAAAAGAVCRPSVGVCDVAEVCNGVNNTCPADTFVTNGTTCRAAAGPCDAEEQCTGTSAACPPDSYFLGLVCRASTGVCDAAGVCNGTSPDCPADVLASSSTVCRPAVDLCDVPEYCTGIDSTCPPDAYEPSGYVCRPASGSCDLAETCTGSSTACPADAFAPSSTVCRASAGPCDLTETCTGIDPLCPADAFAPNTTVCGTATRACEVAATCTGYTAPCPANDATSPGVVCRPAVAGINGAASCDVAESCDGVSLDCPPDAFQDNSTVCRPSAGLCDVAESCTGTNPVCPADAFLPAGYVCATSGVGNCLSSTAATTELCSGTNAICPAIPTTSSPDCGTCVGKCCGATGNCPSNACESSGLGVELANNIDECWRSGFSTVACVPLVTGCTLHCVGRVNCTSTCCSNINGQTCLLNTNAWFGQRFKVCTVLAPEHGHGNGHGNGGNDGGSTTTPKPTATKKPLPSRAPKTPVPHPPTNPPETRWTKPAKTASPKTPQPSPLTTLWRRVTRRPSPSVLTSAPPATLAPTTTSQGPVATVIVTEDPTTTTAAPPLTPTPGAAGSTSSGSTNQQGNNNADDVPVVVVPRFIRRFADVINAPYIVGEFLGLVAATTASPPATTTSPPTTQPSATAPATTAPAKTTVSCSISLRISVEEAQAKVGTLLEEFARVLRLDKSKVRVKRIYAGSTIVEFEADTPAAATQVAQSVNAELSSPSSVLVATLGAIPDSFAATTTTGSQQQGGSSSSSSSTSTVVAAAVPAGLAFLATVGLAGFFVIRRRRDRRSLTREPSMKRLSVVSADSRATSMSESTAENPLKRVSGFGDELALSGETNGNSTVLSTSDLHPSVTTAILTTSTESAGSHPIDYQFPPRVEAAVMSSGENEREGSVRSSGRTTPVGPPTGGNRFLYRRRSSRNMKELNVEEM